MNAQKAYKLQLARNHFARQVEFVRLHVAQSTEPSMLLPALEFLEWLVRDMTDLAGLTVEVQEHARELVHLRTLVAGHYQSPRTPTKRQPQRPKLRVVR